MLFAIDHYILDVGIGRRAVRSQISGAHELSLAVCVVTLFSKVTVLCGQKKAVGNRMRCDICQYTHA